MRNVEHFRALRESEGIDTIHTPDGDEVSLWDLESLIDDGLPLLPPRQRQSIELVLIQNCLEREAAVMMGVSVTNPVAMYATKGLEKIIQMIEAGELRSPLSVEIEAA